MTYTISKDFTLSYSHRLEGLPVGHQCARHHGHNAVVRIVLASDDLDDTGFVVDYGELKPIKTWIDNELDHQHLNEIVPFNPTAELLAAYLHQVVEKMGYPVVKVGWSETPLTWAWYEQ